MSSLSHLCRSYVLLCYAPFGSSGTYGPVVCVWLPFMCVYSKRDQEQQKKNKQKKENNKTSQQQRSSLSDWEPCLERQIPVQGKATSQHSLQPLHCPRGTSHIAFSIGILSNNANTGGGMVINQRQTEGGRDTTRERHRMVVVYGCKASVSHSLSFAGCS